MKSQIVECTCGRQRPLNRALKKNNPSHCSCGVARFFEDGIPKGRITEGRKVPAVVKLKVIGSEVKR